MMDVVMVALAIGFCALSIAYVYACESCRRRSHDL